ncbi:MAG: EAL domain-containing protein [Clostridia bacterium]|nr:EAL domain-containing protein [Clostridia bacterium]
MLGTKKVIGVCITNVQNTTHADFVNHLYQLAQKQQIRLVVLNSFLDFGRRDAFAQGAASVYGLLDFDLLDAAIIMADSFADQTVVQHTAARIRSRGIPLVVVNGQAEGANTIRGDGRDAFKQMISHVIREHGARSTCLMTDSRETPYLTWYREALEENSIRPDETFVRYGCGQPGGARQAVDELLAGDSRLPQAFICTDDRMAFSVCDALREQGYRVPDDVIVTGFGGIPDAQHFSPRLTTCSQNMSGLARKCLAGICDMLDGKEVPEEQTNYYTVDYTESCGCQSMNTSDMHATICRLYCFAGEQDAHEDEMYSCIDRVLAMDDVNGLYPALSGCMQERSCVCLEPSLFGLEQKNAADELLTVPSADLALLPGEVQPMRRTDVIPRKDEWAGEESLCVISAVYAGQESCGYYAVRTSDLNTAIRGLKRELKTINIAVSHALNELRQRKMRIGLENALLTDPISGLPNVKGAQQWFESFSQQAENRNRTMAISVYGVPKYSYIYEHYGIQDCEELLTFIGNALQECNPQDSYIAHIADNEFVVITQFAPGADIEETVNQAAAMFFSKVTSYNEQSSKTYYLEINHGCSIIDPGWSGSLESFVKYAVGEMYLNRMRSGDGRLVKEKHSSEDYYSAFNLLVEKNLFTYHFQPIVDARTGNVYAYEALMRTAGGINMSPLDVLEIARKYGRLYEIEKATLFNVMRHYVERYEEFGGHLLFINTIPGHFLNDEDCELLMEMYGEYMDHVVFELTEQNTISDNELQAIRRLRRDGESAQIAVDDYGTGHSNIVNLLRYAPQVIKIDRFLISGIQNDINKQMFVKNTIEFARLNGIKTLAEGVETFDELQTVIEYGMDLVQGYYLGYPIAEPVVAIRDQVKNEIVSKNIRLSKLDSDMRAYTAKDGETINLLDLAINKYTFIDVFGGQVTLVGEKDHTVDMVVRVADNVKATLVFHNANFKGATETTVQIGSGCQVDLVLEGENTLYKEGILVPPTSSLLVKGNGNLTIIASRNEGVGIGANYHSPYGSLTFDLTGAINVEASGDNVVCIGGGKTVKECIHMINGSFNLDAKGINIIGVGSSSGNADIRVENAELRVHCAGDDAVAIGSVSGRAKVRSTGYIEVLNDCENAVGIGSMSGRESELYFNRGKVKVINRCFESTCIGSMEGSIMIYCTGAVVDIYAEGTKVTGIGSMNGRAQTIVSSGTLCLSFLAATVLAHGNTHCQLTINGGNVLMEGLDIRAKNLFGMPLVAVRIEENSFEKQIDTDLGSYIYRAQRDADHPNLCVFLPEEA